MARSQKPAKFAKKPSHKAANALGYAKRQSRKTKESSSTSVTDVYEFQQEKVRRSKVKLQYERDELLGAGARGSESEDEDGGDVRRQNQPRLIGEGEENEQIDEDEDEDIDSDAAFDESDEERYAGFSFSHKKQTASKNKPSQNSSGATSARSVRFAEVDLNEDDDNEADGHSDEQSDGNSEGAASDDEEEEEEEEGEPGDFLDVLDVLDGRAHLDSEEDMGDIEREAGSKQKQDKMASQAMGRDGDVDMDDDDEAERFGSSSEGDEDEDDEEENEEQGPEGQISASEEEQEQDELALQNLGQFVTSLGAGQKRKASNGEEGEKEGGGDAARVRKRRLLKERTEAGEENEFAAHIGGRKLNIDDLLAPLTAQSSNLLSLKKSAKVLTSQSGSAKTLAAPLPQRTAERLDREAAYEQTKEEVDKWKATMQRIKEAEHLSFPLQAQPTGKTSNLELAAKFKPTTELESAVDKLLKSAKMRDEDIAQTESLKLNHLSVEEVAARRAELAKMRELMFRADAKAKRVAKIKSKTYRRLKKKEKARLAAKLGEGGDAEDEDDEEVQMKREVERARERATLRHKNTGKWAKSMKARGELDEDQRKEINEMLDRGERLRKKISGKGSDEESSDDDESDEDEDGEVAAQRIKASAFEELAGLDEDAGAQLEASEKKGKSIFEMKFMKDAMARDQRRVNEMMDDFVKEMGGSIPDEDREGSADVDEEERPYGTAVERVGGRVIYRPGAIPESSRPLASVASDTSSVTLKSTDLPVAQPESIPTSPIIERADAPPHAEEVKVNPWLARTENLSRPMQKRHEVAVSKDSGSAEKSKNKLRKRDRKREEEKEKANQDATVDIEMTNVMTLGAASSSTAIAASTSTNINAAPGPSKKPSKKQTQAAVSKSKVRSGGHAGEDSDSENSEVEEQERQLDRKGKQKANGVKAFEQRDLVALAFAGDNVVQDFAEQKRREMQEDAPKEVDTTLPGWGSWGGKGARKAPPKPFLVKKVAGVDPTTRADYKKAHVIISEKRDKKAAKYLVKDLPFPYTSKAQYERSLDTPIGTEWNTRVGFQRATLPKIVKKPGMIISPLEKLT